MLDNVRQDVTQINKPALLCRSSVGGLGDIKRPELIGIGFADE